MHYELTYIISGSLPETEQPTVQKRLVDFLTKKYQAKITKELTLGRRRLTYPIKKEHSGTYLTVEFDLAPEQLKSLDQELKLDSSLLRHLIVKKQVLTPEQEAKHAASLARLKVRKAAAEAKVVRPGNSAKINLEQLDEKLEELLEH